MIYTGLTIKYVTKKVLIKKVFVKNQPKKEINEKNSNIQWHLPTLGAKLDIVKIAKDIATKAHKGQKRKVGDEPYIVHPQAIAERMTTNLTRAIAWLHDVVEDTDIELDDIEEAYKEYPDRKYLIDAINCLTHRYDESYLDYLLRVKKNHLASKVKIADMEHNLSTAPEDWKHAKDKWLMGLYIIKH